MSEETENQEEEKKVNLQEVEETQEVNEEQEQEQEENTEEINWKKFREKREQERKEKEDALRLAKEREEQILAYKEALEQVMDKPENQNLTQQEQDQIISDLMDEEFTTGADIKGFINKAVPDIVNKVLESREEQRRQQEKEKELNHLPQMLQREHKDFSQTVNQENLDYLEYHYPEVAEALGELPNGFNKWTKVYKTIKKLVPSGGNEDVKRIDENLQKPQSASFGSSQPTGEQGYGKQLTEKQKMENYRRLQELARGV